MQRRNVLLIAKHFWATIMKLKAVYFTLLLFFILLGYAGYTGYKTYVDQNNIRDAYQKKARESWEANPDKHPHRMAHFGSFAFRVKHPLSMFDFGLESYTGNAVFLEAHKQNTVNFSEASFSTGILRFGEISMAMLLYLVVPLIIFFLGYGAIATEREASTLKLLLSQGASWKEIIVGKTLGLFSVTMLFYLPVMVLLCTLLLVDNQGLSLNGTAWRLSALAVSYLLFYWIACTVAVIISAYSLTAKSALLKLLGVWMALAILLPKIAQAAGTGFFQSPTKFEFEAIIEKDLIKQGDSHNPDDIHYKALKDSVLRAHGVQTLEQLPFNYAGFVMQEGERLSSAIYNHHLQNLLNTYESQNSILNSTAWVNPITAIRNISMAFSGVDFYSYNNFQSAAEAYRYELAQQMNALQVKYISNRKQGEDETPYSISRSNWKSFPDFHYNQLPLQSILRSAIVPVLSLIVWTLLSLWMIMVTAKKVKAI